MWANITHIVPAMLIYAIRLGTMLECTEITITGEVFRTESQVVPSWHPFGYIIGADYTQLPHMLSFENHQLLSSCAMEMNPTNCDIYPFTADFGPDYIAMFDYLSKSSNCCVFPPLLMFHGRYKDGVHHYADMMMTNVDHRFEGFFMVFKTDFSYNGKTVMMAPATGFYTNHELGKKQVRMAYVLEKSELEEAIVVLEKALIAYNKK